MLLSVSTNAQAAAEQPPATSPTSAVTALIDAAQSRALFDDTNATRLALGLPALSADERLNRLAAQLAAQMVRQDYFGHTDPSGVDFEQRIRAAGIPFTYAEENIAIDQDAAHAQNALMNSPDHYANIVDTHVRRLGTAAVASSDGALYFVQEFSD